MTEYQDLANRLQASPLYRRLGHRHAVSKMLMQKVYRTWLCNDQQPKLDASDYGREFPCFMSHRVN